MVHKSQKRQQNVGIQKNLRDPKGEVLERLGRCPGKIPGGRGVQESFSDGVASEKKTKSKENHTEIVRKKTRVLCFVRQYL